jgi:circadian clock protein KaiC
VPGLDPILGGGLPERGIVFLVGAPGTGKTILAQQVVFALGRRGGQALYFSGLSESHDRLVEHGRSLSFFDESLLADRVQVLSLSSALEEGADAAVSLVVDMARRTRAKIIVVDGLATLRGPLVNEAQLVTFLYRLGSQASLLGALLVVTLEAGPHSEPYYPELATADVVLALYLDRARVAHRRYLEVMKRRGGAPVPGLHPFVITENGITAYAQFETTVQPVRAPFDPAARASFGLTARDTLLGGGLTRGTTTLVAGAPGTGKTLLALHFLAEGVAHGEPGLLLGFHESREQVLARSAMHGLGLEQAIADGRLQMLIQPPIGLDPDMVAHALQNVLAVGHTRRLVIDSVAELEGAVSRERVNDYLAALVTLIRGEQVTALLTSEVHDSASFAADFTGLPISVLAENVLLLRRVATQGRLQRVLAVLKMRFAEHDCAFRDFTINERGLTVLGPWQMDAATLRDLGGEGRAPAAMVPPQPDEPRP